MAVRYYKTGGKRYYVIDVQGYPIAPASAYSDSSGSRPPGVTYAVLDRDTAHQEIAVFESGLGRPVSWCKRKAEELAKALNRRERGVIG